MQGDDRWPEILHTAQKETSVDIYGGFSPLHRK